MAYCGCGLNPHFIPIAQYENQHHYEVEAEAGLILILTQSWWSVLSRY